MDFLPDPHDQDLNTVCIITGLTPYRAVNFFLPVGNAFMIY